MVHVSWRKGPFVTFASHFTTPRVSKACLQRHSILTSPWICPKTYKRVENSPGSSQEEMVLHYGVVHIGSPLLLLHTNITCTFLAGIAPQERDFYLRSHYSQQNLHLNSLACNFDAREHAPADSQAGHQAEFAACPPHSTSKSMPATASDVL